MDPLDSIWNSPPFQQQSNHYFSDYFTVFDRPDYAVGVEPSYQPNSDSPTQSLTTPQIESKDGIAQEQRGEIPKRASNTIFKTGVSCYRKSLLECVNRSPDLQPLLEAIDEVNEEKNMSVFPKLNFMVRWLGLAEVAQVWTVSKEQMLQKKKKLHQRGKYPLRRLNELAEIIKNMDKCIEEDDFDKAFRAYWGDFRQHSKHSTCKDNVVEFSEQFKRANPQGKMGKKGQEKKENKKKNTKKTKKANKAKKTNAIKTRTIIKAKKDTNN